MCNTEAIKQVIKNIDELSKFNYSVNRVIAGAVLQDFATELAKAISLDLVTGKINDKKS